MVAVKMRHENAGDVAGRQAVTGQLVGQSVAGGEVDRRRHAVEPLREGLGRREEALVIAGIEQDRAKFPVPDQADQGGKRHRTPMAAAQGHGLGMAAGADAQQMPGLDHESALPTMSTAAASPSWRGVNPNCVLARPRSKVCEKASVQRL